MNAENFVDYLVQPAKLYQLPYQEIKNLVADYPYSANLRRLLLLKSKIEQDPKFEQHLHQLAAHTCDRASLYELIAKELDVLLELDTPVEERLELKDLAALDLEEKVPIPVQVETPLEVPLQQAIVTPNIKAQEEEEEFESSSPLEEINSSIEETGSTDTGIPITEEHATQETVPNAIVDAEPAPADLTPEPSAKGTVVAPPTPAITTAYLLDPEQLSNLVSFSLLSKPELKPQPSTHFTRPLSGSFHQRQQRFQRLRRRAQQEQRQPETSPAQRKKPLPAKQIAKRSLKDQPGLASETLAKLLVEQEQYTKAIKIYQRLSLRNPEKSRYFAATIEKLKLKL